MDNKWKVFKVSDPNYTGHMPWRAVDPYGSIRVTAQSFEEVKKACEDHFAIEMISHE